MLFFGELQIADHNLVPFPDHFSEALESGTADDERHGLFLDDEGGNVGDEKEEESEEKEEEEVEEVEDNEEEDFIKELEAEYDKYHK